MSFHSLALKWCSLPSVHCHRDSNVIKLSRVTSSMLVMPLEPIIHLCGLFLIGLLKIMDKVLYKTTHWNHSIQGWLDSTYGGMHTCCSSRRSLSSSSSSNKLALSSWQKSKLSQELGPECKHRKNFTYCAISMQVSRSSSNPILSFLCSFSASTPLSMLMFRGNFAISFDHTIH